MEQQFNELLEQIRAACSGHGDSTAEKVVEFIRQFTAEYAEALSLSQFDVLVAVEKARDHSAANYYQEAHFPKLAEVSVYATRDEFLAAIPSRKFRCPCCKGESTDPNRCNSGVVTSAGNACNWASFGLFRTMGEGLRVVIKDTFLSAPVVHEIFMPLELEQPKPEACDEEA